MKIVLLNTMYAPRLFGGAEKVTQVLAEGLVEKGHDVAVIAMAPGRGIRTKELNGVRVHEVGLVNLYWPYGAKGAPPLLEPFWHAIDIANPWMVGRVGRLLAEERPQVLHTHGLVGFSPWVWRQAAHMGLPIVHTLHDYRLLCVRATMFKGGRRCERACHSCRAVAKAKRPPAELVDVVVGVSSCVLDRHLEGRFFQDACKEVIPVPVGPPAFSPRPPLGHGRIHFGYLGRLQATKGVESLLRATLDLPPEGWDLAIAGTGEERYVRRLERMPRHPQVRFVGRVEPSSFLDGIDALVFPSQWEEPAGLAIVEAFGHGIPVLASRRGGPTEIVEHGRTGWFFDPERPSSLTIGMRRLIEDPDAGQAMQSACRAKAEEHDPRRVVDAYVRCYELARARVRSRDASP